MDISRASVFLDFDGTITTADVGVHLLERLASSGWRELDVAYGDGSIGSRECLVRQWELLPRDERVLREVAAEVGLDPGFDALLDGLRAAGAEVTVVSDGLGFYAEQALAPYGVELVTNAVDFITGALEFPNLDRCCPCSTCGTCKQAPLKDAARRGRTTVFVGEGISDRKAALVAQVLFAKGALAEWCEGMEVPFVGFARLDDVRAALLG